MIRSELLIMRPVTRLVQVQECNNEARQVARAADAARCLNILGRHGVLRWFHRIFGGVKLTAKARAAGRAVVAKRATARAADLAPIIAEIRAAGIDSLRGIAAVLNERGISTPRGHGEWSAVQVSRVLERIRQRPR